jgi:restriction system protein
MPWWAGVVLALVGYLLLHSYATSPPSPVTSASLGPSLIWGTWARGLAMAGQFIVPIVCLLGALLSFLKRRKRQSLHQGVRQSTSPDALEHMSWQEFELLVGEGFRQRGYAVTESGGGGADGGVDLILRKNGQTFLVQCKQWKAFKVGVSVVRELYGVMAARGAAGGFVITSGRFTDEAQAFAAGRNLKLLDGPALLQLIRAGRSAASQATPVPMVPRAFAEAPAAQAPACPVCSKTMVRRVAQKGARAGSAFWGCMSYPGCRGTRPL